MSVIERKIEYANLLTRESLNSIQDIGKHDILAAAQTIRGVYSSAMSRRVRHWANFSKDISLTHQLLIGPPSIVNIWPLEEHKFKEMWGFSIEEMTTLAEKGVIIPNIYERNPAEWSKVPDIERKYRQLLNHAIVNGEITDTYLDLRQRAHDGRSYSAFVGDVREQLNRALTHVPEDQLRAIARGLNLIESLAAESLNGFVDGIATTVAYNYGYLEAFAPQPIRDLVRLKLTSRIPRDIIEALKLIRVCKHAFASPLTTALGGHFIWPQFARDARDLFDKNVDSNEWANQFRVLKEKRELVKYVYESAIRAQFRVDRFPLTPTDALGVLLSHDFRERTQLIWDLNEAVTKKLSEGEIESESMKELDRLRREMDTQLRTTKAVLGSEVAIGVGGAAFFAGTYLHWPVIAGVLGLAAGVAGAPRIIQAAAWAKRVNDRSLFFSSVTKLDSMATKHAKTKH